MPAADLAQSAPALRGLRGAGPRHQGHVAACRRNTSHSQSGIDDGAGRRARTWRQRRRSENLAAGSGVTTGRAGEWRVGAGVLICSLFATRYLAVTRSERLFMLTTDNDILKAAEDWRKS